MPRRATVSCYGSGTRYGNGSLSTEEPPADQRVNQFTCDPANLVPSRGGHSCCTPDVAPVEPYDQAKVGDRADVLVYSTPPLEADVEVTGPIEMVLFAASTAPDTDFTAKLVDVHPDGKAYNISNGIIRASSREGLDARVPVEPGEVYEYTFALQPTSNLFKEGHQIRVEVLNANFSHFRSGSAIPTFQSRTVPFIVGAPMTGVWKGEDLMDHVDAIVVGAGVVGLAVARELARRGMEVLILERAGAIGTETSSRNSEVIHAGIYYQPGSLKARLCVRGREMLYDFAAANGVAHRRCGKLIVATSADQHPALDSIAGHARACGVDLQRITAAQAQAMEPELACTAALLSPSTGIIDSHGLMLALQGQAESHGAALALNTALVAARARGDGFEVDTDGADGRFTLGCRVLVNAAGLRASDVARAIDGLDPGHVPDTLLARGSYFAVPGRPAFSHLVYPVPEPGGLGVHLTLDLGGSMRFGPDVEWIDRIDYQVNGARMGHFADQIARYWPGVPADALEPTYCGIRPKLSGPGQPAADFRIDGPAVHGVPGLVNLFGIESPGLTASLAIAEHLGQKLDAEAGISRSVPASR
nr:FAD-dependent oxidoreductase [uncultured Paracoccus sp.]